MVQLQLTVREYQDLVPLEGVNVEVTPILVFRWRTGLELEKRPRRDASVGGEGGSSGRSIDAPAELVGETGFHEVTRGLASVNGVTDGSGRVAFGWDPAAPPISDVVTDVGTPLNGREQTKLMEFRIDTTLVALGGRRPLRSVPVHHRCLSRRVALDEGVGVDPASTIVGARRQHDRRLWFALWQEVPGTAQLVVDDGRALAARRRPRPITQPVVFPTSTPRTAVADVVGFTPATSYTYESRSPCRRVRCGPSPGAPSPPPTLRRRFIGSCSRRASPGADTTTVPLCGRRSTRGTPTRSCSSAIRCTATARHRRRPARPARWPRRSRSFGRPARRRVGDLVRQEGPPRDPSKVTNRVTVALPPP